MVLLTFFSLLLLVAFPLGEFSRITIVQNISISLLDVVVAIGAFVWLVGKIKQKTYVLTFQSKAFLLVTGIFFFSLLVNAPLLTSSKLLVSGLYGLRFFCYGIVFFIAQESGVATKKKTSWLLFIGGLLLLVGGYVQYFLYPSLRNLIYFGWDEHFYRMFGTFFDPNFFGLFLTLFFLFVLSKLFTIHPQKQKNYFAMYFLLATAIGIGIILTYSRTALLALFVGLLVLFWNKQMLKWVISLCAGVGIVLMLISLIPKATNTNTIFRISSASARLGSAQDAIAIFLDNPVIGVGFNAYRYSMYRHHFQPGTSIQEDHGASGADSSVLLVLATSGVVGETLYLLFLFSHAKVLATGKNKVGLATLMALFVGSFFVNGLFYPLLLVWLWALLGITENDAP